jgi:alkylhydroperoxidase family enzyme
MSDLLCQTLKREGSGILVASSLPAKIPMKNAYKIPNPSRSIAKLALNAQRCCIFCVTSKHILVSANGMTAIAYLNQVFGWWHIACTADGAWRNHAS